MEEERVQGGEGGNVVEGHGGEGRVSEVLGRRAETRGVAATSLRRRMETKKER